MSFAAVARTAFFSLGFALLCIAAPLADDDGEEGFNPVQKKAVEDIVRQYLMDHPEVIVEAFQEMQRKEQEAQKKRREEILFLKRDSLEKDPTSPVGGNPEGDVTIVEFFDYNCGYCKRVWVSIRELLEADQNIRYVFKEYPILGPESVTASRAAIAIWKLDPAKYMEFHTALMESRGGLTEAKIMAAAEKVGLGADVLRKKMAESEIDQTIRKNFKLARELDISGTPAFVIGDHLVPGAADLESLKKLVARSRDG